jgi:hypothetical protein
LEREHRAVSGGDAPRTLAVPKLHVHKGLPFGIDVGAMYSAVPNTNIKLMGAEVRYALVEGGIATPAVGLRASGDDGRFLWLKGIREISGVYTVEQLQRTIPIQAVQTIEGAGIPPTDQVELGPWIRPLLKAGRVVLLVEPETEPQLWRVVDKERVKQLSS